jgi:TolA-binding protein
MEAAKNYEKRFELIEAYIHNELSNDDQELFDTLMRTDEDFKEDVEIQQQLAAELNKPDRLQFRAALQHAESIHRLETQISRFTLPRWVRYAAAIIIIGAVSSPLLYNMYKTSPKNLYEVYYESYESSSVNRGGMETTDFDRAMEAFDEEDFDVANNLFTTFLTENPENQAAAFYKGMCLMELEDAEGSVHYFERLILDANNLFVEQAQWYVSLAYLKLNTPDKAVPYIEELSAYPNPYREKALKLLDKLKRL